MIQVGTRTRQNVLHNTPPTMSNTRGDTRDLGMTKNVTASFTFVNSTTQQIQAANGTFSNTFAVNDVILVQGTNLNDGCFTVTGLDTTNNSYLVVSPSCKNEGPITATIRTS